MLMLTAVLLAIINTNMKTKDKQHRKELRKCLHFIFNYAFVAFWYHL